MRRIGLVLILMMMLAIQACVISCDGVIDENSTVDGYKLEYEGQTTLAQTYTADTLEIESGIATIDLKGDSGSSLNLLIGYREYEPGDASISIQDGKITTSSKSGKPVLLTSIVGTIPANLNLKVESGTGSVALAQLSQSASVAIETGTGKVVLSDVQSKSIGIDTGTGAVNMDRCLAVSAVVNTGTGSIYMSESYIEEAEVNTGTGSLNLKNSTIERQKFVSGTGKLHQDGEYQAARILQ